mmetsp:Transcript_11418/g.29267  ORF Transcript_11418/g.29267 Transcript_11418/m.29267 type:complete len:255 (+) Transcript_11418:414-1178(+)
MRLSRSVDSGVLRDGYEQVAGSDALPRVGRVELVVSVLVYIANSGLPQAADVLCDLAVRHPLAGLQLLQQPGVARQGTDVDLAASAVHHQMSQHQPHVVRLGHLCHVTARELPGGDELHIHRHARRARALRNVHGCHLGLACRHARHDAQQARRFARVGLLCRGAQSAQPHQGVHDNRVALARVCGAGDDDNVARSGACLHHFAVVVDAALLNLHPHLVIRLGAHPPRRGVALEVRLRRAQKCDLAVVWCKLAE